MSRSENLLKKTGIYFIGNFASKILVFLMLPLYTTYLKSSDFGIVDLYTSILPLIIPIFTLQVTESVFRYLIDTKDAIKKVTIITNSLAIILFGVILFIVVYIPILLRFDSLYMRIFPFYFLITYFGIYLQQVLRGFGRSVDYAITGILSTFLQTIINVIFIVSFNMQGESLFYAAIGGSLGICFFSLSKINLFKYLRISLLNKNEIIKQLKYGVPLIPNQIAWWIISLLSKYVLLYTHGSTENGIIAIANKFPSLLTVIISIFLNAWAENFIIEFKSEDKEIYFKKGFSKFTIFMLSITCVLLPLIKIYCTITLNGDFINAYLFIPTLFFGAIVNSLSIFLATYYTASTNTKVIMTTTLFAAAGNLLFSILLIPLFSIWGVVFSNLISFVILLTVRIVFLRREVQITVNSKEVTCCIFVMISCIIYYINNSYLQIICAFVMTIFMVIINKDIIRVISNMLKKSFIRR